MRTLHLIFVAAAAVAFAAATPSRRTASPVRRIDHDSEHSRFRRIAHARRSRVQRDRARDPDDHRGRQSRDTPVTRLSIGRRGVSGTRDGRHLHFNNLCTIHRTEEVFLSLAVLGGAALRLGHLCLPGLGNKKPLAKRSVFCFGSGGVPSGRRCPTAASGDSRIRCDKVKTRDFFDFYGLDSVMRIESPRDGYYRGSRTVTFKVALNQSQTITFAVAGK